MNLQKLDKLRSLRRIDLKNEYKAHLWKKNKSYVKFIESLSNHIQEYGIKFIVLWENLDFFLAVKDKYDDEQDARDFIESCLSDLEDDSNYPSINLLYKHSEINDIVANAMKSDELAATILTCRFIIYASAYDLLFEVITKVLSGYSLEVAYYEISNKILPNNINEIEDAHFHFADFFSFKNEAEYKFTPYKLYTSSEYILNYDISALANIVTDITDANITVHELIIPSKDGQIFDIPTEESIKPAKLFQFADKPYIKYRDFEMPVSTEDLEKEIFVCSIFLDLDDGKIRTLDKDTEITAKDISRCIKNLLNTAVYTHPAEENWIGNQIEISWIEAE